jgi:tyrosine-protein kinase Etk/Wzc
MTSDSAPQTLSLIDLAVVLADHVRLLILGPLIVGLAALGYAFTITPTYTATTTILSPQQQQSTISLLASQLGSLGIGGPGLKNPSDLYVALLKSRTVEDRMVDRFNLIQLYGVRLRLQARQRLEQVTKITTGKDGLIVINVDDSDPKRAADMANSYVEELSRLTVAVTEAQQRRVFFEKQLKLAQDNLTKSQLALSLTGVPESVIKTSPVAVLEGVARLHALVTAQEIKISTMRSYLTEQSPEFQLAQRELASLRTQLAQAERDKPANSGNHAEYLGRFREFKYHETLFELLAKQYESARLDEAREGMVVQVVDPAIPPEFRSRPRRAELAVLTTVATAILLLLVVFVREGLRNAGASPESAAKLSRIRAAMRRVVRIR